MKTEPILQLTRFTALSREAELLHPCVAWLRPSQQVSSSEDEGDVPVSSDDDESDDAPTPRSAHTTMGGECARAHASAYAPVDHGHVHERVLQTGPQCNHLVRASL